MNKKILFFTFGIFFLAALTSKAAGGYTITISVGGDGAETPKVAVSQPSQNSASLNFVASCVATPIRAEAGSNVTFAAGESGGVLPISYEWSGDIYGKGQVQNAAFGLQGIKTVWVTATDAAGHRVGASCSTNIFEGAVSFNKQHPTNFVSAKNASSKVAAKSIRQPADKNNSTAASQNKYDAELVFAADTPETKPATETSTQLQAKTANIKSASFLAALFPLGGDGQLLFVYLILIIIGLSGTVVYLLATRNKIS